MASRAGQIVLDVVLVGLLVGVGALVASTVSRTMHPPQTVPERARVEAAETVGHTLQVEVLNGTMTGGIAGTTRDYLRGLGGFDVVQTGNDRRRDRDTSFVVDRVGDVEGARRVARALGLDEGRVRSDPRSDLYVDATVVLGADYEQLAPFQPSAPALPSSDR